MDHSECEERQQNWESVSRFKKVLIQYLTVLKCVSKTM